MRPPLASGGYQTSPHTLVPGARGFNEAAARERRIQAAAREGEALLGGLQ